MLMLRQSKLPLRHPPTTRYRIILALMYPVLMHGTASPMKPFARSDSGEEKGLAVLPLSSVQGHRGQAGEWWSELRESGGRLWLGGGGR